MPVQGYGSAIATVAAPVGPVISHQPQPVLMSGAQPVPGLTVTPIQSSMGLGLGGTAQQLPPGGYVHPDPAMGIGRTGNEMLLDNIQFAHANNLSQPQDFKPADDDPSRHYYCRELDGVYTVRSRFSIDKLGDCRWYLTDDGVFYAVRLPG
jgi:hypothetical protein